ncbi:hypothetical protein BJ138DRAFT_1127985 [Hygrophoropsis aurantiaca]|uniref:Uncharacterized protein n=1 Tax=Hygrophoropsis aurantiaca TaxID=72124 RepID=A0ACB8A719_9AGAM|nr:hypothetical protein BJ138DRAFT_1127985 [Hygrophoropsis aurantiaca]
MSIAHRLFCELRPLVHMLEEPLGKSTAAYGIPARALLDDPFFAFPNAACPAVDVTEHRDKYIVEADLPGVKREDVVVRIGDYGRSVTIEGKTSSQVAEETTEPTFNAAPDSGKQGTHDQSSAKGDGGYHSAAGKSAFNQTLIYKQLDILAYSLASSSSRVSAKLKDGLLTLTALKGGEKGTVDVEVQ